MAALENSSILKESKTVEAKKRAKLSLEDLFLQPEDEIILQLQEFSKEFREEFCRILAQTNADKKIISHKAELVSKSYVACVLDYRSSVIRHAIFAMDVFTQVPRDIVNQERIHSEITRIKDDWTKFKKFYEVIKPLASTDPNDITQLSISNSRRLVSLLWKIVGYATALALIWATYHTTLFCNSLSKASQYTSPGMRKRLEKLPLSPDPNKMMKTVGENGQKFLWWSKDAKSVYQRGIEITVRTSRQNLRLMLIFNFVFCLLVFIWYGL
ncbi:uncharacterized protein LOC142354748 [Convolutriloba macropyga]|uniref:uncharacterized protein LOC142354748 n=1 Tax=Convolutriloba macropyga TaxID=536237 RepID=UPI003F520230